MIKKFIWPGTIVISIVMVAIFIFGFSSVIGITSGEKATEDPRTNLELRQDDSSVIESNESKRLILIMGDSIGAGVGDERNLGIGERFINLQDYEASDLYEVVNYSVPGAQTNNLLDQISTGEMDKALEVAQVIIISIGGNNLNRIRNTNATMQVVEYEEMLSQHISDLKATIDYIREINTNGEILVLGLYNPYSDSVGEQDLRLLLEWNYQTRVSVLEYEDTSMIPLYDVFANNLSQLLAIDNFHPSGDGYEVIAQMIEGVIE